MVLLCVNLLRGGRLCSLSAHLTRKLQVRHRFGPIPDKLLRVSSHTSCLRTANAADLRTTSTAPLPLSCSNEKGTDRFRISPQTPPVPRTAYFRTQFGHHFHTSAPVRAIPAAGVWILLKPLQKIMAVILGRSIRKWWVALPPNRRQLVREYTWQHRWNLAACAGVAVVIITLFLLTHLDEAPLTGRTRLLLFSRESYSELAEQASQAVREQYAEQLLPFTDPLYQAVDHVVQYVADKNKTIPEVSEICWTLHVVQSPEVNAFAFPNGEIYMFTGMLDTMADLHQFIIVLGHEMAHAVLGHSAEQASLSHIVDLLSMILLMAIWALCPRDSLALLGHWVQEKLSQLVFTRPYSRKLEAEADEIGLLLAAQACADVRSGPVFWHQMEIRAQLSGEATVPEWLSTHPSHKNRMTQLDRLVPQALEVRESCACPSLPSNDPRVVFASAVQMLLEQANEKKREEQEGAQEALRTHSPTPTLSPLPAALLARTAAPPFSAVNQKSEGPVSIVASGLAAEAPAPAGHAEQS